ncbi:hypothetical protein BC829DRAFT_421615 [Chytridium lagenaria]|nr:hypothetical protein BC829DRAFT_421615 [Chytridium lagenaria]
MASRADQVQRQIDDVVGIMNGEDLGGVVVWGRWGEEWRVEGVMGRMQWMMLYEALGRGMQWWMMLYEKMGCREYRLNTSTQNFATKSKDVRRKMFWKDMKTRIILGVAGGLRGMEIRLGSGESVEFSTVGFYRVTKALTETVDMLRLKA